MEKNCDGWKLFKIHIQNLFFVCCLVFRGRYSRRCGVRAWRKSWSSWNGGMFFYDKDGEEKEVVIDFWQKKYTPCSNPIWINWSSNVTDTTITHYLHHHLHQHNHLHHRLHQHNHLHHLLHHRLHRHNHMHHHLHHPLHQHSRLHHHLHHR